MELNMYMAAVGLLLCFAVFDIMVGVSNDAVNFLNSSFGSKAASRRTIMIIASIGIIAGVIFSSGMMEVARKGIFHPQYFTMPDLITIFLAVMITDVILLDLFNTFGLPTSTTVSIVFELLGAAVAISIIKAIKTTGSIAGIDQYINTAKAMMIIFSILLSVFVAFFAGAITQFITRLVFTFDYLKRMKRYGAIWGGIAMASITFFIVIKGAKGVSFMTPEVLQWIKGNTILILLSMFAVSFVILQTILTFFKVNILRIIILVGTFALAMAFAANDLVNFIGVPLAGLHAFKAALLTSNPLTETMGVLGRKVQSETLLLLIAGVIMVITLWFSKKSRTVSETEINLAKQDNDGVEKFESIYIARVFVRMMSGWFASIKSLIPMSIRNFIVNRMGSIEELETNEEDKASFDLIRASVNLMVASTVVSFATSLKLPLSTTYVTFMVAMGTSFSDGAWGRDSAVYRITGVMTVIGGWFLTAFMAFSVSCIFAFVLFYLKAYGAVLLLIVAGITIWKTHHRHKTKDAEAKVDKVFNLKKITEPYEAISITFDHMAIFLKESRKSLDLSLEALFASDLIILKQEKKKSKKVQRWSGIITANIFKPLRLLQKSDADISLKYAQTIRRLQKLSDGHRDITFRGFKHVDNHHNPLLDIQIEEIKKIKKIFLEILLRAEMVLRDKHLGDIDEIVAMDVKLRSLAEECNQNQIERIKNGSSKTRLTILYYAIIGNAMMISKQNIKLLEIFGNSFTKTNP